MSLKKLVKKISKNRALKGVFLILLITVFSFLIADSVLAVNWFVKIAGGIISGIVYIFGWILMLVVRVLVYVAQYNNFLKPKSIIVGWTMVRDLANMFFIVILLIISFATILRIEKYNYKKWLPKLLLMAILINFSKTICGLMIDVAQVIMLSFVNSFKGIANYNITTLLGIDSYGQFKDIEPGDSNWDVMAAYGLMLLYTLISLVVMIAMTAMLIMRIVMIWVYVVLSPLAFLLQSFPDGQSYASKWWTQFSQNLIIGPVLAFFIWLSFMTVNPSDTGAEILEVDGQDLEGTTEGHENVNYTETGTGTKVVADVQKYGQADSLLRFIVGIAMLLGGLKVAQDIGGEAGSALGKVSNKGFSIAKKVGASTAKWAGRQAGDVRDVASKKLGVDLNVAAGYKRYQEQSEKKRQIRKDQVRKSTLDAATDPNKSAFHRKMALLSTGDLAYENLSQNKFFKGGSPKKEQEYADKLENNTKETDTVNSEINELNDSKSHIITKEEADKRDNKIENLETKKAENDELIETFRPDLERLESKEEDGTITEKEEKELNSLREEMNQAQSKSDNYQEQINNLQYEESSVVEDEAEKEKKELEIDVKVNVKQEEKRELNKARQEIVAAIQNNKLADVSIAKSALRSQGENKAAADLTGTSASGELIAIFKEAMAKKDTHMMGAAAKKMAKEGNYNDLMEALNLGTGREGMLDLAKLMQDKGKMGSQESYSLVSEIGEICKANNQIQGWGAVSMNETGQWKENSYAEQQSACFSELAKIQVQKFVRDFSRLGTGHYEGGDHTDKNWVMDASIAKLLASKDDQYSIEMAKTGNVNTIKFIASNPKNIETLIRAGAVKTAKIIKEYANKVGEAGVENPQKAINDLLSELDHWDKIK